MANPSNFVTQTGRLARDVYVNVNKDGSKTILGTLMVQENFTNREGKVVSQPINFQSRISDETDGIGGWANTGKGDLIQLLGRLTNPSYEKDGQTIYPGMRFEVEGYPQYLEPRSVTQARRSQNTDQNNAAGAAHPAPAAEPFQPQPAAAAPAAQPQAAAAPVAGVPEGWTAEQYIQYLEQQRNQTTAAPQAQSQVQPGQPAVIQPGNYDDRPPF